MRVKIVRFCTDPQHVGDAEHAIADFIAAVKEARPAGIEYTAGRIGDRPEFLLMLRLADDLADGANPLFEVSAAEAFRERIAMWAGKAVPSEPFRLLGQYVA